MTIQTDILADPRDPSPEAVARLAVAAHAALIAGDLDAWAGIIAPTADFTLMDPFGGPVHRGFRDGPEDRARRARLFHGGRTSCEVVASYASGDLAVVALRELGTYAVADLAEQPWGLRVTLVFRREGGRWRLAHRHADPLDAGIDLGRCAALARGA